MAKQLLLIFILSLSYGTLGLQKNLEVKWEGTSHSVYVEGEQWFRSSSVLRVKYQGTTWSTEEVNEMGLRNQYVLKATDTKGEQMSGSDSIGSYTGVK